MKMHFSLCVNAALVGVYVQILEAILSFCFLSFVTFENSFERHALEVKPACFGLFSHKVLHKSSAGVLLLYSKFIRVSILA